MTYYDEIAEGYDELHGSEQLEKYRVLESLGIIGPDDTILDVGHGTGLITQVFSNDITGLDASERLLEQSTSKTIFHDFNEPLPFDDASFDWVVSFTAIHHARDPKAALDEMVRVARRGVGVSILRAIPSYEGLIPLFSGWERHRAGADELFIRRIVSS